MEKLFSEDEMGPLLEKKEGPLFMDFFKNWNHKLLCVSFITVRPKSKKYQIGDEVCVRLDKTVRYNAIIQRVRTMTIDEIMVAGYNLIDAGMNERDYLELLESMYEKKSWWKGRNTQMNVIFLKQVTQLEMFDT